MAEIDVKDGILPISEFRANMSELIERTRKTGQPIVLTQHGKSVAVVLSPAEYAALTERERFVAAVNEGLKDLDEGRFVDDDQFEEELEKRRKARRAAKGKAS